MIKENKLITLEDDQRLLVTEVTTLEDINYFRAVEINDENTPTEKEYIFKDLSTDVEMIIEEIEDEELYETLEDIFDQILIETFDKELDAIPEESES